MDFPPCAHGCGEHHQHHDTDPSLQGYWVPHYALDMSLNHGNVDSMNVSHLGGNPDEIAQTLHISEVYNFTTGSPERDAATTERSDSPSTTNSYESFAGSTYIPSPSPSPQPMLIDMAYHSDGVHVHHASQEPTQPQYTSSPFASNNKNHHGGGGGAQESLDEVEELLLAYLERKPLPLSAKGTGARRGAAGYMCRWPDCTKQVKRRDHAKAHVAAHFGLKPFGCPHCPRSFLRPADQRRHIKASHFRE